MRAPALRPGDSAGCSGGSGSNLYTGSRHQERTDLGASAALTIPQFHQAQVEQRSVGNLYQISLTGTCRIEGGSAALSEGTLGPPATGSGHRDVVLCAVFL